MRRTRSEAYVRWGELGALYLVARDDALHVVAGNGRLVLEPRRIAIEMEVSGELEVEDGKTRHVYVYLRESVKPLQADRVDVTGRALLKMYEVIYTDLGFQNYLTIITSSLFQYNYAVLTDNEVYINMGARRKAYFERSPQGGVIIYIT
ncbi:MAG: hypothetical protein ABWW70_01925 [Thermoproteota archaeon]